MQLSIPKKKDHSITLYSGAASLVMMTMGPQILTIHLFNLIMMIAGLFYLICALLLLKRVREEKNELISALFAFLLYQALNMFFLGLMFQTKQSIFAYLSGISILIGSAYMLKFPFHSFSESTRKVLFTLSLIVAFGIFGWFVTHPALLHTWTNVTLGYDIVINGLIVGGFIIFSAIKATERWSKFKAVGGGAGVAACCIVGNATLLSGALVTSAIFQFLAPVLIIGTLAYTRYKQKKLVAA